MLKISPQNSKRAEHELRRLHLGLASGWWHLRRLLAAHRGVRLLAARDRRPHEPSERVVVRAAKGIVVFAICVSACSSGNREDHWPPWTPTAADHAIAMQSHMAYKTQMYD